MSYPETIELTPNATGVYVPDFNASPTPPAGPIVPYTPTATPVSTPLPPPPPSPSVGGTSPRAWSPSDYADFGTDEYNRPIVVPGPDGNPRFNSDLGFSPDELDAADRQLGRPSSSRTGRRQMGRALGGIARNLPGLGDLLDASALGSQLGEAIGTPLGAALADWLDRNDPLPGTPGGSLPSPGSPPYTGGQCPGTLYKVKLTEVVQYDSGETRSFSRSKGGSITNKIYGPVLGVVVRDKSWDLIYHDINGNQVIGQGGTIAPDRSLVSITIDSVSAISGPDDCGDLTGPIVDTPVAPAPPTTFPAPSPYPAPAPAPYPSPPLAPAPYPYPAPQPVPTPLPPGYPTPVTGPAPAPVPLPQPLPAPRPAPPSASPPTAQPDCCPSTDRSLSRVEDLLSEILNRLESADCAGTEDLEDIRQRLEDVFERLAGAGEGIIDLSPCEGDEAEGVAAPTEASYSGEGLAGIYSAIAAITQSLNLIHTDTKCPPEIAAALPMHFEARTGEIPQLVVLWGPTDGGSSRWSMTIPHPRSGLNASSLFSFPEYLKGSVQLTLKLKDNSKIILNAGSKASGLAVLNYAKTLVDSRFLDASAQPTITENIGQGQLRSIAVKSTYIHYFEGHKSQPPLWSKPL